MRINTLDEGTIEKIAAGEVIERPASVVRELVDNAIDAGADSITVQLDSSEPPTITVTDNGGGMTAEELAVAVERHTTSKIRTDRDLLAIATLGFRGEALASINAVSKLTITTRTPDNPQGSKLTVQGAKKKAVEAAAAPVGTRVTVADLFFNTRARRKFLRSRGAENAAITATMQQFSLAWPAIRFRLGNNKRTVLASPGTGNLRDAVAAIMGTELAQALLPCEYREDDYSLSGYIAHPRQHRSNRNLQYFTVNKRPVSLRQAAAAVEKAYHTLLPQRRYPVVFLNLTVPGNRVDVNVHPTKRELKFADGNIVFRLCYHGCQAALEPVTRPVSPSEQDNDGQRPIPGLDGKYSPRRIERDRYFRPRPAPAAVQLDLRPLAGQQPEEKILGQILSTYLVVDSGGGLRLIDQHAAQERVMYEKFTHMLEAGERPSQVMIPLEVQLPGHLLQFVRSRHGDLTALGFKLRLTDQGVLVQEVPLVFKKMISEADIVTIMEQLMQGEEGEMSLADHNQAALMMLACKSALKANQKLSPGEARELLAQLAQCKNQVTCPHGRPISVSFDRSDLEKMFARR